MTGILPVKKYGNQSALSEFEEFTMVTPDNLMEYVGFTEYEVHSLCEKYSIDFEQMKQWYDGYLFYGEQSVYSPNSVMSAIHRKAFRNYWTKTETYESLKKYICMNMDGLKDAIILMLGGQHIKVNTLGFQNDMVSMKNRDDILTLLVHLGYLAYNDRNQEVWIPNLEIADSFQLAIQDLGWSNK